jgi:hypothetical protein
MVEFFNSILLNSWYSGILVFFTQILMLYFRTINIFYTTQQNMFGAIWSNNANAVSWLLSMTIGMNSMLHGQWQAILMYLLGGTLGTYWGIKREGKIIKNKIDYKSFNIGK